MSSVQRTSPEALALSTGDESTAPSDVHEGRRWALLACGTTLGTYVLEAPLGAGGGGSVFAARHATLGHRVAIKVQRHAAASGSPAGALKAFVREGRAAARVSHPHVVRVHDVGEHDGLAFLVMDLLEGATFAALLEKRKRLAAADAVDVMLPIIAALAAAHRHGVIHRDVKPSNIVLKARGDTLEPVLVDFGVSKILDGRSVATRTAPDAVLGTIAYLAPEAVQGASRASEQSDQYAVGVVLYECLTGHRPFAHANAYELMQAIVGGRPIAPTQHLPSLSKELEAIVLRAMHRSARRRFGAMEDLGAALLPFASVPQRQRWERTFASAADAIAVVPVRRPIERRGTALAGVALLSVTATAIALMTARAPTPPSTAAMVEGERRGDAPSPSMVAVSTIASISNEPPPLLPAASSPVTTAERRPSSWPVARAAHARTAERAARPPSTMAGETKDLRPADDAPSPLVERGTNGVLILP